MKLFGFSLPGCLRYLPHGGRKCHKANVSDVKRTEYPIWHKLRKAAGRFPCSQVKRRLPSALPSVSLYRKIRRERDAGMVWKKKAPMLAHRDFMESVSKERPSQKNRHLT